MKQVSANPTTMKRVNSDATLATIRQNPGITKPQIAKALDLSLPTVNKLVAELEAQQYVRSGETCESGGGRPARMYYFNENRNYVVSVYIGGGAYHVSVSNSEHQVRFYESSPHEAGAAWAEELCALLETVLSRFAEQQIKAIAVAVPGTVDGGVVYNIPTIPAWEGFDLKGLLEQRFGLTVFVENEIKAATMGIYDRHAKDGRIENMVFLYLGTGIGAGIVLNGRLYRSRKNFSGELSFLKTGRGDLEQALQHAAHAELLPLCADMLNNIICVLEPDLIAVACEGLCEADLEPIRQLLKTSIAEQYLPELTLEQVSAQSFTRGLTVSAIALVDKMLRIV